MNSSTLFASLIWGTIGLGFAIYGKKQDESVMMFGGLALIGISYFIGPALWMSAAAIGIIAVVFWLKYRGG